LGGRSIFWGGWSPELLEAETPADAWPARVLAELRERSPIPGDKPYFRQAAEQIGVTETNDFVFGEMHKALRQQIFEGIMGGAVPGAVPLNDLELHLDPTPTDVDSKDVLKLEAPLAVQGHPPRSGFFPFNKFSAMPLLMKASREAQAETGGDDRRKRLMVVPNAHVTRLETVVEQGVARVVAVHVGGGPSIPVPDRGVVVLASGTIESTRVALLSFEGTLGYELIGTNLLSHMRSNYTFRIPREALRGLPPDLRDLQASALFVKGRKTHEATDRSVGHFHLQVTAAGCKGLGTNSEAELQQKIPDIDTVDNFRSVDEDHVVITLRGVGELQAGNPANRVTLSEETDEFGVRRAFVQMGIPRDEVRPGETLQTTNDRDLWNAMDRMADDVRAVIVGTSSGEDIARTRDGLGTTHHEAGTLWMGTDPAASVTTPDGRFHHVVNTYAVGPAVLPTIGSPNPMLSGVALARRLADRLVAPLAPPSLEEGFVSLFDGTAASFSRWAQAGPGRMRLDEGEGVMVVEPGDDIGLCFFGDRSFGDFVLRLQFRIDSLGDNSGIFIRFRDPRLAPPDLAAGRVTSNPAWIAVRTGFEVQIDEIARDDGADLHRTGALYGVPTEGQPETQSYSRGSALQPGAWNDYEISVSGDRYRVRLNDHLTSEYVNLDADVALSADRDPASGFIGLQQHTGAVSFRAVRLRDLSALEGSGPRKEGGTVRRAAKKQSPRPR
jgi:choline dehydrogenase-like flavoprotein